LVLSDVHYPFGVSTISYEIIKKENPDRVVLLGDLVVGKGEQVIERMKSFFENYPFSLKKSVVLIGDNEYKGDKEWWTLLSDSQF
jgi:Calcineurin-like phosphoesterase.